MEEELQVVPGCSKKKADLIVASRPFTGWIDLVGNRSKYKLILCLLLINREVFKL